MSPPLDDVNLTKVGVGPGTADNQYAPQPTPSQTPHGISDTFVGSGGSEPIFSMYLEMAAEEDRQRVENWKADADGMLIFTGLFSAAVASLVSVSIQDLRPNPQDTSNFYLANIYQTISDPSRSNISSSLSSPPPFTAPKYAVWVNSFWFLSLLISLTCALLATLLQQWARRYLRITQTRYTPHKRARIRSFFAEGVDKFLFPWVVETLPMLLHISLFLFFAGVVLFLCNIDLTIFKLALSWVGICVVLYGCITFMPVFHHDSPYYTPLSLPAWHIVSGILYVISWLFERLTRLKYFSSEINYRFAIFEEKYGDSLVHGMSKTAEFTARHTPPEIDIRAFLWTFDILDEDHELERFFAGVPGFTLEIPLPTLTYAQRWKFTQTMIGFLNRTFSSDVLPDSVKNRRAVICAKAIDPAQSVTPILVLNTILSNYQHSGPLAAEILRIAKGWSDNRGEDAALVAQATISSVVARAQRRDDSWFILASSELGIQQAVLRDYAAHGDNLSLAVLIHITRQQFSLFHKLLTLQSNFANVLEAASDVDVQNTSTQLQHDFCALWNEIVLRAQKDRDRLIAWDILRPIRNVYVALHQGTSTTTRLSVSTSNQDEILWRPSSYPLCNVPNHHPNLTPHIHVDATFPSFSHSILRDNAALVPAPSSAVPIPVGVDQDVAHMRLLEHDWSVPPSNPALQTASASLHVSATSPGLTAAGETREIDISASAMPPISSSNTSTPPSPVRSTGTATFRHNTDLSTSFGALAVPGSASPNPALGDILPAEPRLSVLATTAPGTSPRPPSAPYLSAAAEDERSPEYGLRIHEDPLDPSRPSNERVGPALTMDTRFLPLPSSPLLPVTNMAIVDLSECESDARYHDDIDRPPDAFPNQYDVV